MDLSILFNVKSLFLSFLVSNLFWKQFKLIVKRLYFIVAKKE